MELSIGGRHQGTLIGNHMKMCVKVQRCVSRSNVRDVHLCKEGSKMYGDVDTLTSLEDVDRKSMGHVWGETQ